MQHTLMQLLSKARALQAQGNLAGALREYEAAAQASGHHPAVAAELISAQMAAGRAGEAVRLAAMVVERHPRDARVRLMLAQVLAQTGEPRRAIAEIETARKLDSRMAEAPALEGALHGMLGDHARSEQCFRDGLAIQPGHAGLLSNLGHALKAQGKFPEALAAYRQALARENHVALLASCADVLGRLGRTGEAISLLEGAPPAMDGHADLHHALGNLYEDEGRLEQAARCQERALALNPHFADAAYNLGAVHAERERWGEARAAFERALAIDPGFEDARAQLIAVLRAKSDYSGALKVAEEAFALTKTERARMTRADLLFLVGRLGEAVEEYRAVVAARAPFLDELHWEARLHLALALLSGGDLEPAWVAYAEREDRRARGRRDSRAVLDAVKFLRESSGPLPRVLVDKDQGIGDQLFFLRFAAAAAPKFAPGSKIAVGPKLRPLLRRLGCPFEPVDEPAEAADCTAQIWVSDLPLASAPGYLPPLALSPDPKLVEEIRAALARCGPPPYIGVTWRAGARMAETDESARRFVKELEPDRLAAALRSCGATLIVLQRGLLPGEGDAFASALGRHVFDFDYSDDLERMLALLSLLDEYVAVSNTNIHLLAGLKGSSARVLVPSPAEWRWHGGGRESPWFPGFIVYRQDAAEGWSAALQALAHDCRARFPGTLAPAAADAPKCVSVVQARRYSAQQPSSRYQELVTLYRHMHAEGDAGHGISGEDMFRGISLPAQAARVKNLIVRTGARTILDYGSGKGKQYESRDVDIPGVGRVPSIRDFWGVDSVRCYDPGYPPFSELPTGTFDGVIATDVLEHCPEEDLEWIVGQMFSFAARFVYASVASYPASKSLPTGENAHITQRGPAFWDELFGRIGRTHPRVQWEVHVVSRAVGQGMLHKRLRSRAAERAA